MSERETLAEAWLRSDRNADIRAQIRADVMAREAADLVELRRQRPTATADELRHLLRGRQFREIRRRQQAAGVAIPFTGEGLADALKSARLNCEVSSD
jgi:hypothetical protein